MQGVKELACCWETESQDGTVGQGSAGSAGSRVPLFAHTVITSTCWLFDVPSQEVAGSTVHWTLIWVSGRPEHPSQPLYAILP